MPLDPTETPRWRGFGGDVPLLHMLLFVCAIFCGVDLLLLLRLPSVVQCCRDVVGSGFPTEIRQWVRARLQSAGKRCVPFEPTNTRQKSPKIDTCRLSQVLSASPANRADMELPSRLPGIRDASAIHTADFVNIKLASARKLDAPCISGGLICRVWDCKDELLRARRKRQCSFFRSRCDCSSPLPPSYLQNDTVFWNGSGYLKLSPTAFCRALDAKKAAKWIFSLSLFFLATATVARNANRLALQTECTALVGMKHLPFARSCIDSIGSCVNTCIRDMHLNVDWFVDTGRLR